MSTLVLPDLSTWSDIIPSQLTAKTLFARFSQVRLFHLTRSPQIGTIINNGIHTTSRQLLEDLVTSAAGEEHRSRIHKHIATVNLHGQEQQIYFFIDPREAELNGAGHYGYHGSETANTIAYDLGFSREWRTQINQSIPTFIVCDVPLDWLIQTVVPNQIDQLLATMRGFAQRAYREDRWDPSLAVAVNRSIPAGLIVGHYHPQHLAFNRYGDFTLCSIPPVTCSACGASICWKTGFLPFTSSRSYERRITWEKTMADEFFPVRLI